LFSGKSQLIVYHFMFGPGWKEGCEHCSFWADHFDCVNLHIGQRDTAFAVISRGSLSEIEPFKQRMGWRFNWVSSFKTDFNFDFNVSFTPEQIKRGVLPYNYGKLKMKIDELQGVSAFYRDKNGEIYHTYSSYSRGIDLMNNTYNVLDLTAKGRDENADAPQDWVRKLVAFICHGGWIPISARILKGKRATGSLGIKDDLENAGAIWVDEPVVVDGNLISSRTPLDLAPFANAMVEFLQRG
jgi:predicted dithiol-disulfide oxidoreductase (DUF899 family)